MADAGIVTALAAFAGASIAQIANHHFAMRRARLEQIQKAHGFAYALIAEVNHASLCLANLIAFLDKKIDDAGIVSYEFHGDPIVINFAPEFHKAFEPSVLFAPDTVVRARQLFASIAPVFESLKITQTLSVTEAGFWYLVNTLRYGLSMSVRLQKSVAEGQINLEADASIDELVDFYRTFKFAGGGRMLTAEEVDELLKAGSLRWNRSASSSNAGGV